MVGTFGIGRFYKDFVEIRGNIQYNSSCQKWNWERIGGDLILKGVKNVKIEWNRRYTTIAVYAILVLVFGVLFLYGVQNYQEVKAWFSAALVTLRPFIFGFVIAYLLNPIYVSWIRSSCPG